MKKKVSLLVFTILMNLHFAFADVVDIYYDNPPTKENLFYDRLGGHGVRNNILIFLGSCIFFIVGIAIVIIPIYLSLEAIAKKIRKKEIDYDEKTRGLWAVTGAFSLSFIIYALISKFFEKANIDYLFVLMIIVPIITVIKLCLDKKRNVERKKFTLSNIILIASSILLIIHIGIRVKNSIELRVKLADFRDSNLTGYNELVEDIKLLTRKGTFEHGYIKYPDNNEKNNTTGNRVVYLPSLDKYANSVAVGNGYILDSKRCYNQ